MEKTENKIDEAWHTWLDALSAHIAFPKDADKQQAMDDAAKAYWTAHGVVFGAG